MRPSGRCGCATGWASSRPRSEARREAEHPAEERELAFQRVDDYLPPAWPDPRRPQQFHLDIRVEDVEAAEAQILALGATLLDPGGAQREWRVYADPAGHPFCFV